MSKSDNYTDVFLEEMNGKFDRLIDVMGQMQDELSRKANQSDIDEIKADVKIIKAALTDTNEQVRDHENRITALESA